jgi:hypothetical protein
MILLYEISAIGRSTETEADWWLRGAGEATDEK